MNFFKFKLPAASGPCPDSSFSILLCKGIVKDFFKILDAGRRDITDVAVGAVPKGGPLWESREMLFVDIIIRSSQVTKPFLIDQLSISPIVHNGTPKAPFIGELAAEGGLRG